MTNTLLKTPISTSDSEALNEALSEALDTVATPVAKSQKRKLVARWLVDENSKLFCQWVIED